MFSKITLVGVALTTLMSSFAYADSWEFDVTNKSSLVADGFRTQEDGQWSRNWLNTPISPGDNWTLDFGHSDGDCVVRTQVHFTDNTYFDYDVDYCKAKTLYIYNRSMKYN